MRARFALALPLLLAFVAVASAQGFSPEEATKRMKLADGFSVRCVAHEPMVRQPVSISFDNRGRMWVLQYLQYPNYAGLKALKQDQYLRTIWDKVPEPPPHGPKGADKLTILFDPDQHGVFSKSKDFVTGLNIASGFCIGNGGVYVAQPPYLLFYPDKNEDDMPDGDPEVLLTGFGMDDTHSLANSLQFGPDGWLYGAAGSTSTCKIKNPNHPKDPVVEFQQGIWRYHPKTKKFELFSEGGGNPYGLDFDKNGQAIVGTNYGGVAGLHQMQGAYYVKGFSKHGPLHNPHTYGYFEHIPYTGFKGGHVTCGGIVYQADAYPKEFRDQYIAANLLSNTIDWHKLEPVKSSFKMSRGGELIGANDTWFRPVDLLQGPDGCVYVVDFYDRRAAHLDPVDNWDKTNGRIYRIEYKGGPDYPRDLDLRKKTKAELLALLKDANVWYRREARQLLARQPDEASLRNSYELMTAERGNLALEGLWALAAAGGFDDATARVCIQHPDEYVRAWGVRLIGDRGEITSTILKEEIAKLALDEKSPVVRAQLACTAKRLPTADARKIVWGLLTPRPDSHDTQQMLLTWWAIEATFADDPTAWMQTLEEGAVRCRQTHPELLDRVIRRLVTLEKPEAAKLLSEMIDDLRTSPVDGYKTTAPLVLRPLDTAITGSVSPTARKLEPALLKLWDAHRRDDDQVLRLLVRLENAEALENVRKRAGDATNDSARISAIDLLRQVRDPKAKEVLLTVLAEHKSDSVKLATLAALEGYDDPQIGEKVLDRYTSYSPAMKKRAVQLLLSRPAWALGLFKALDAGKFPKTDVSVDQARIAVALANKDVTALVEKHFGKVAPATAGEKQARISWLNAQIPREKGADATRGKALFTKHCAACHVLHGEGGKVGPDLTTADRKNRGYMIAQIVDPSGYIRPEFVVQTVLTTDERKLSGIAKEVGETVELSNF
ncbi:MAG: PVC-type heme-binding CxxCH protein, partial [Gemmataceae bacterium]